ncbi:MAG: uroporphyrinogen-III synthase [Planctomycetaceae bacterium]|nr:uroporphyrinogen-III synthase [Planctomycetaceae bacterium]
MTATVLLTRAAQQTEPMKSQLENIGFKVYVQPVIEILPPDSWDEVDDVIFDYSWCFAASALVFTSSNGVKFFFDRVKEECDGIPFDLYMSDFAAVGPDTNETLKSYIKRDADMIPAETFNAEGLLEEFKRRLNKTGYKNYKDNPEGRGRVPLIMIIRGSRSKDVLKKGLTELGAKVKELTVYQSVDVKEVEPEIAAMMSEGKIDWTTAMSPAAAKSLIRLFGNDLHKTKIVSISPAVSQVLIENGYQPALTAKQSSVEGIIEALSAALISGHCRIKRVFTRIRRFFKC